MGQPTKREQSSKVVVSAGFHRTHVTIAAREASARGALETVITGAYPTAQVKRRLGRLGLGQSGRIARLLERDEGIPDEQLSALFGPELLDEVLREVTRLPPLRDLRASTSAACMRLYGYLTGRELARTSASCGVFHFRAGFGGASVPIARRKGLVALCDHSAVHPVLVHQLLACRGNLACARQKPATGPLDPVWQTMLADLNRADAVLLNSHFLKDMFLSLGWPPERIYVAYVGVDDHFLRNASGERGLTLNGPLRLLFAGRFERSKGADEVISALSALPAIAWELEIAGPVARDVASTNRRFFADSRVSLLGTVPRSALAERMKAAHVFVFPSHAEGSARVVFEALACGCYVITTPNAGSIVENGVHGALVPPGKVEPLVEALVHANKNRALLAEIGPRNAGVISTSFTQRDYGRALEEIYGRLASMVI